MENEVQQTGTGEIAKPTVKKRSKLARGLGIFGVILLILVLALLTVNAMLTIFKDDYYTTFGEYRLFSIVSDSMEPNIPKGSMIVSKKPTDADEIKASSSETAMDGTVITFKAKNITGEDILLTHRVVGISTDSSGKITFTTRGDNAGGVDSVKPDWNSVVGIYTGKKVAFLGSLFGFFQSSLGASVLIFSLFVVIVAWIMIWYVNKLDERKKLTSAALKKSSEALSSVNLRYDNIHEITAVMDILGMVSEEPKSGAESREVAERLTAFINATTIELPQTPETAAILDSLPAPDTPGSLAAALSTGATLRQAEDGQTLIMTTLSGDKHILLTPINTPDGIILCQQGVRVKSDIAPNIEDMGATSMPTVPEFFEGQPLEKNIVYPELPQPGVRLSPETLLNGTAAQSFVRQLSDGQAIAASPQSALGALPGGTAKEPEKLEPPVLSHSALTQSDYDKSAARLAYARYRELSSQLELKQAEQLAELLSDTTALTQDEQRQLAEYRAAHRKEKKPRKPLTDEQKQKRKAAAERRKIAQDAFLATLTPEDRELYLTEQKLAKSREAAIRRLKRIAADRRILEKLNKD